MQSVKSRKAVFALSFALLMILFGSAPIHATNAVTSIAVFNPSRLVLVQSSLVEGPDGNFYAAASSGGVTLSNSGGTTGSLVQITPQGVITTLHAFAGDDGVGPTGLVLGPDGNLYGATRSGGSGDGGTLFKLTTSGAFSVVYAFPNGTSPSLMGAGPTQLTVGVDGNLYGITEGGGANACGAVFRITLAGVPTVLYSFPQIGGSTVPGAAPMAVDGNNTLYGIGGEGIFSLASNGSYSLIHQFPHNLGLPMGQGILRAGDGSLYGPYTDYTGSAPYSGVGAIYKLSGTVFTTLITGISSGSLIDGGDGFFYGTGNSGQGICGCGEIFKFTPSGTLINAYYFNGVSDGGAPTTPLVRGSDGYFYGATATTVYRFDSTAPLPPTITLTANPNAIVLGSPTTLSWSASNASSCAASNAWSGSLTASGSTTATPTTTGEVTYTLTCTGTAGSATTSSTVLVDVPASATIGIAPSTVDVGQTAVLSWSGNSNCSKSGAWSGSFAGTGTATQSVSPGASGSYVYTLTCSGPYGISSATDSATLTVRPLPTVNIAVNPPTMTLGGTAVITWSTTNATSCSAANAWSGTVATSGSRTVTPSSAGNYVYALTCTGPSGMVTNSATLAVSALPPTETIVANPAQVTSGQSAELTWTSSNATSCSAQGAWNGGLGTSGTQTVAPPPGTSVYGISCTGPGGTSTSSTTLTVTQVPAAPTATLSSSSSSITLGQTINLSWSSTNANTCTAGGSWSGSMATSGSMTATPATAGVSTYSLACSGAGGTASAKATVTVTPVAPPSVSKSGGGGLGWPVLIGLGAIVAVSCERRRLEAPRDVKPRATS